MHYEDLTYREAEVRLREHAELRAALAIEHAPDDTTLYCCLRRIGEEELTLLLQETIRRMPPAPEDGTSVAIDGTGLAPGAISTFFVNRARDRGESFTSRHWHIEAQVGHRGRSASTPHPGTGSQAGAHH